MISGHFAAVPALKISGLIYCIVVFLPRERTWMLYRGNRETYPFLCVYLCNPALLTTMQASTHLWIVYG